MEFCSELPVNGTITVVTYNLWGIFNSKYREARMTHFAKKVSRYDVMLLQEQFSAEDFDIIINSLPPEVRETRYFRRFPSAYYGSGIAVISRFPVKSALFYTYPLQGFPERVLHGDYYANKGAALVRLDVPISTSNTGEIISQEVLLYSTHLVAVYEKSAKLRDWSEELYLPVRLSQAISLADFIMETSTPEDSVIIGGDFNATQRSLEVQTMLILLRRRGYALRSVIPPPSSQGPANLQSEELALLTFSHENMFTSPKEGWLVQGGDVPLQIDHLFFSSNTLRLCAYEDCPDAPPAYPFHVMTNGMESPAGVVVFTQNEVRVPPRKTLCTILAAWLEAQGKQMHFSPLVSIGAWLGPPRQPRPSSNSSPAFCPISDHYGVAARIQILGGRQDDGIDFNSSKTQKKSSSGAAPVQLTEVERIVMRQSTAYLGQCVEKYNAGSRSCKKLAIFSGAVVLGNLLLIAYLAQGQRQNTAQVLEQIHTLVSSRAVVSPKETATGKDKVGAVLNWASGSLRLSKPKREGNVWPRRENGALDFGEVAGRLHAVSVWSAMQPVVSIVGGLVSFGSLAISLLQRRADANVLDEQARRLRRDRFHE